MNKDEAISKIKELNPKTFNKDQKETAIQTLNWAPKNMDVSNIYNLLTKSFKLGFVFDEASPNYSGKIKLVNEHPTLENINCLGGGVGPWK